MAHHDLDRYSGKRDFRITTEPSATGRGKRGKSHQLRFVVQKHWARRLHYDFRLELDGVLVSWAVPKGPSFDPTEKRMAIHVEDHPLDYANFEGTIPPKQYGAGTVIVWDHGTWEPVGDPHAGMEAGKLEFLLHGQKLAGRWELVRISRSDGAHDQWILFKKRDQWARSLAQFDVISTFPDSVIAHPLGALEAPKIVANGAAAAGASLVNAKRSKTPAHLSPQLAVPTTSLPSGGNWIIEAKFDGYRVLARIIDSRVTLLTRGGEDWTNKLKGVESEIEKLGVSEGWIDGEIVVLRDGVPDFNALQNAIKGEGNNDIVYFVFDIPYWEGKDLRRTPLSMRRAHLAQLVEGKADRVRFSESFEAPPAQVFKSACELGLEGLVLKRADSAYTSTRSPDWIKAKCKLRQEFVICGFGDRAGSRAEVGRLLLGVYDQGKLRFAGSVGTGWTGKTATELREKLEKLQVSKAAFDASEMTGTRWAQGNAAATHWVRQKLVAEVEFSAWTRDGRVRHASFKGLRSDKSPKDIRQEAVQVDTNVSRSAVNVTHPERVIDSASGIRKLDLVRYYESVAEWMLPHLAARPVAFLRAPDGIGKEVFFQKHLESSRLSGLTAHPKSLWPGHGALLTVDSADALAAAAQLNAVEFHTWNSTVAALRYPDRIVFDLDPGEGVSWRHVLEAAQLVQGFLTELALKAWLKTSGGKGLHVVVPLAPELDYPTVKGFSHAVVCHLAKVLPERFVAKSGAANRKGKVFVDYLRNGLGQTTVAAFSARARPGMGVSMPISWRQLSDLKGPDDWNVRNAREYLSFQRTDPWRDYWKTAQTLTVAMERLG
ncbi:ATP-dependent DNA ligase LigD phosphoesterase module /ATP-dependent DNA ligase LigD polymerase module [Cupriavidus sp. YR651]|uniref:DNA ligase D n=1 Tax=Cupriavidus sp. YR651 TaxID=1855315 RepID=UPI00088F7190|nr:DNA ligase D [Cupriavidus sp. YR651]SDC73301.1 ATP-dependent DNA ligase LigD phosphoesterase module /ATP-dependent DNA ligase LigD polymerase module [Cupriavidus sp. YR651]